MSLLNYFQRLPNADGPLSATVFSRAINEANILVEKEMNTTGKKKRGPYKKLVKQISDQFSLHVICRYSPETRAEIGKYACQNGITRTARYFSRKLKENVSESTVQSIRKTYLEELRKRRRYEDEEDLDILRCKKRGRPVLLGKALDSKVQAYLSKLRENGASVSARIVIAAARGIVMTYDRSILEEFGGHVCLNKHWAHSILSRMNFVKRRATTAKSKESVTNFDELKRSFLDEVRTTVSMENIPPELIMNWDQTGIKLVPSSNWTMEKIGTQRVEIVGVNDKRQITAVFFGTLTGDFLPIQLIYQGKSPRCHPHFTFPEGWHITHSPRHWSTEQTMLQYIGHIVIPYVESIRELISDDKPALVIMDNFKGQVTVAVNDLLEQHNIHVCLLPPNTTDLLQPMDLSVNKPAKDFLRREFEQWYAEKVMSQLQGEDIEMVELPEINLGLPVLKEVGAKWLVKMAEYIADNPRIIVNGFMKAGIASALDDYENDSVNDDDDDDDDVIYVDDSSDTD